MNTRHYLETALQSAINVQDLYSEQKLIESILATPSASLYSLDDSGRSFFLSALEGGAIHIANEFLALETNSDILYMSDKKKRTPIQIAIQQGYRDIVEKLM